MSVHYNEDLKHETVKAYVVGGRTISDASCECQCFKKPLEDEQKI